MSTFATTTTIAHTGHSARRTFLQTSGEPRWTTSDLSPSHLPHSSRRRGHPPVSRTRFPFPEVEGRRPQLPTPTVEPGQHLQDCRSSWYTEESAEAIVSADVQMCDRGRAGDRFGQRM
jgi:hypothetical protein